MYSRVSTPPPEKIVRNGKIKFGTFFPVPQRIDIRGVIAPFAGLPLPSLITNFRIRSRIIYMFSVGTFIGFVEIFDGKIFALADVILWNRETGKKYFYHTFMTARLRFVPVNTDKGLFSSFKHSKQIRIMWDREKNKIILTLKIKGDSVYPGIAGFVHSAFEDASFQEFTMVTPAPVTSRCSATWVINSASHGSLSIAPTKSQSPISVTDNSALSCFVLNRMFYKFFHSHLKATCGIGMFGEKKLIFRFVNTSFDAIDSNNYNENFLTIDGKTTLMPPVVITHSLGISKKWVIQDTENMVDLTFTPVSVSKRSMHLIFFYTLYNTIYGTFDGVLMNSDGEKITVKDFPGIATSNMMRL